MLKYSYFGVKKKYPNLRFVQTGSIKGKPIGYYTEIIGPLPKPYKFKRKPPPRSSPNREAKALGPLFTYPQFGRRRSKSKGKKPPVRLMKACRKHRIKCTKKVGKRTVYKSKTLLMKQLRKKLRSKKRKSFNLRFGVNKKKTRS